MTHAAKRTSDQPQHGRRGSDWHLDRTTSQECDHDVEMLVRSFQITAHEIFRMAPASGRSVETGALHRSLLACVVSGSGTVTLDQVSHRLERGAAILIPKGRNLIVEANLEDTHPLVVVCINLATSSALRPLITDWLAEPLHDHDNETLALDALATIIDCIERPQLGAMAIADALLKVLVIGMLRRHLDRESIDKRILTILTRPEIARVVNLVAEDPAASHTAESMAFLAGVPTTELARRFREMFGLSPVEYVRQARLHKAETLLLETELPVKTIAGMIGFDSRSHFSRLFCRHAGVDPTTFRKRDAQ